MHEEQNAISKKSKENKYINFSELENLTFTKKVYANVVSSSKVDIFPEVSGKIEKINFKLGDKVKRGDVVISLDKREEANNLNKAKINLELSKSRYNDVLDGSRDENQENSTLNLQIEEEKFIKIEKDLIDFLNDTNFFLERLLNIQISEYFDNMKSKKNRKDPTFNYALETQKKISDIESDAKALLALYKNFNNILNSADIFEKIDSTENILEKFLLFIEKINFNSEDILYKSSTEISAIENDLFSIRKSIEAEKENLKNKVLTYKNQLSKIDISKNNVSLQENPTTLIEKNIAKNEISSAENTLNLARITLSKKIIRSPISGIISQMNTDIGRLVSPSQILFSVDNPSILKIEGSISKENSDLIFVGKDIKINNLDGKISSISPKISSETGEIKFEAIFSNKTSDVFPGEIVEVFIEEHRENKKENIYLPISSIFEEFNTYYVLVLDEQNKTKRKNVNFIKIVGDKILVENTFSSDDKIIINVRGISEGEEV